MGNIVPMVGLAVFLGIYFHFFVEVFEPKSIADKRVLITGASSGIGEELAYQYSRLGAKVFLTARRANLLEKVAKQCEELGAQQVAFVTSDLAEEHDRDVVVAEVVKRLGGLDHLILNHAVASAGLWLGSNANMSTLISDLEVNFVSYADLASRALPALIASKGAIGVVSSIAGKIPVATIGSYSADKFALQGFFGALRVELYHRDTGVTVTTCVLGPVDTDMMTTDDRKNRMTNFWGFNLMATAPETAEAIVAGVATKQREIYHGKAAWIMVTLHQIFPGIVENSIGSEPTRSRLR